MVGDFRLKWSRSRFIGRTEDMIGTKITSTLIGLILVLPLVWTFGLMLFRNKESEEEQKKSFSEYVAKMRADIDEKSGGLGMAGGSIAVVNQITPVASLADYFALSARRWVGFTGVILCLMIAGLWCFSVWCDSIKFSDFYWPEATTTQMQVSPNHGKIVVSNECQDSPATKPSTGSK